VNIEQYVGHREVVVSLMTIVYKHQTDTKNTGDNGYGQPQAVAERCDVAIPSHIGVVGWTYKHVGAGREILSCNSICLTKILQFLPFV
jgi:hypothetical protein